MDKIIEIIEQNFISILGAVGVLLLIPWIKDRYSKRKKISIESEQVFNISSYGGIKDPVNSVINQYSNFIYNEISLKSLNEEVISSIELVDIQKEENNISDIRYDGGFYEPSQKYCLIAYNNGNIQGKSIGLELEISIIEDGTRIEKKIKSITIPDLCVEPGSVKSQYIMELHEYKKEFQENTDNHSLKINVKNSREGNILGIYMQYNRETNQFKNYPRGAAAAPVLDVPIFDLREDREKLKIDYAQNISGDGKITPIGFVIFVDRNCVLSYNVILKSGKVEIKSNRNYRINIRIPVYRQEKSCMFGMFYHFVNEHNPSLKSFSYSLETIRSLEKDIIFDRYKIAEQFINLG